MNYSMHGLRRSVPLSALLLLAASRVLAAQVHENASDLAPAIDRAEAGRFILQLDHPETESREKAVKALREMGPSVIPLLEKALEDASFEAQIKLKELLGAYRERGSVVLHSIVNAQGYNLGIRAGDVITAVNGIPVVSYEDFFKKSESIENSARTITVRTGPRLGRSNPNRKPVPFTVRNVEVGPGKIGVYLADYDGAYGLPLSMALQHVYRCTWNNQWAEAREQFERAQAFGMIFKDQLLQPIYGASCYYSGDPQGAHREFQDYASRQDKDDGWWTLMNNLGRILETDGHLYLYFARQQLHHDPESAGAAVNVVYAYSWSQARYLEASTLAIAALMGDHGQLEPWGRGVAINALQHALDAMDLVPEAGMMAAELAEIDKARPLYGKAFRAAQRSGRIDLALKLGEVEIRRSNNFRSHQPIMADKVVRMLLREGRLDDARRVLAEYADINTLDTLLGYLGDCDMRWSESQSILKEFTQRCLEEGYRDDDMLEAAFLVLSRMTTPDLELLEELVKDRLKNSRSSFAGSDPTDYRRYVAAMYALLNGDDEAVAEHLEETRRGDSLPASFRKAAHFLQAHGESLSGNQRIWKRAFRAFDRPAGGVYILTRDSHIGWSDGTKGWEIPLPESVWGFEDPNHAFEVSPSGKTVLTVGLGGLYRLNADEKGWTRLCDVPTKRRTGFSIAGWGRVLDDLVDVIEADDATRDIAWPVKRDRYRSPESMDAVMFSDGTWVILHHKIDHLVHASRELAELHGEPLEIYEIMTLGSGGDRFRVYSDKGFLDWQRSKGKLFPITLPGVDQSLPIMPAMEASTYDSARLALFPHHGGTTFMLDWSSKEVTREGLINEAYPETYWLQQSVETKRRRFEKAIADKGLAWPPRDNSTTSPAE